MQRLMLGVLLVLLLAGHSWAGFAEGVAAYNTGDYATALREFRLLAEQGDAAAQYNLGILYENGRGVSQDDAQAVRWYRPAAEQGFAKAQFNLGFLYRNGRGVPQDDAQAVRWYRVAAEQGLALAQAKLGLMYENGHGVPQDYVAAHMWYDLAVARGQETARNFQDNLARRMPPAHIAEAQHRARNWRKHKQVSSDTKIKKAREAVKNLDVFALQQRLKAAGYDPGPRDGIMGQKTRAALRQFQRNHGVPVTGEPDAATMKMLSYWVPAR